MPSKVLKNDLFARQNESCFHYWSSREGGTADYSSLLASMLKSKQSHASMLSKQIQAKCCFKLLKSNLLVHTNIPDYLPVHTGTTGGIVVVAETTHAISDCDKYALEMLSNFVSYLWFNLYLEVLTLLHIGPLTLATYKETFMA